MADPQDLEQSNFPGPPGINFRGYWNSNQFYLNRDAVNYLGNVFYCNFPSAGQTPVINDPTGVWSLLISKGDKGDPGIQGLKGDKGDTGLKGDKGDTGLKGDKGDPGLQGQKGDKGDRGDTGLKGDQGIPGSAAAKGDKGDPGLQGQKGDTGLKGDKGDTGLKGDKGDKGDPGSTANAVSRTGDTMTGDLGISKSSPTLYFTNTASSSNNKISRITNTNDGRMVFQFFNDDNSFKSEPLSIEQNNTVGIESVALGSFSNGSNRPYLYSANTSEFNIRFGNNSAYRYLTLSNNGNMYINGERVLTVSLDGTVRSPNGAFIGGDTTLQYPNSFIASESTHSSGSKRAGIQIGKWFFGQDINGNGAKDFFIFDTESSVVPFTIDTANTVHFQNSVFAGGKQLATVDQLPSSTNFITLQQPSIRFEGLSDRFQVERNTAQTTNFADMFFVRDLRGNGQVGTKGYVSSSLRIQTTTENNDGYQWGLVSVLDSYGTGQGQHCGGYFQANRRANSSGIWSLALETRDFTFDPTTPTIGLEAGIFASGADSNHTRIGIDLVVGEASPGVHNYNAVSTGLRIGAQNEAGVANVEIANGIEIKNKVFNGINLTGIDANYSNRGIVMSTGQKIVWDNGLELTTTGGNLSLNMPANGLAPGDGGAYIAFLRVNLGGVGNCCIPVVAYR